MDFWYNHKLDRKNKSGVKSTANSTQRWPFSKITNTSTGGQNKNAALFWKCENEAMSKPDEHGTKPARNRVLDLTKEFDKNLREKQCHSLLHLSGCSETAHITPCENNGNVPSCKPKYMSYKPSQKVHERFSNKGLSVLGNKSKLEERNNKYTFKEPRKVEVKSVSSSLSNQRGSEAFTKVRVKRLHQVFMSFSEPDSVKIRARRLKCTSCEFYP